MPDQSASSTNCCTARLRIRPRHMIAVSSSARNPMDSTRTSPDPMVIVFGTIFFALASTGPSRPSRRGIEKPQMSASSTPTT